MAKVIAIDAAFRADFRPSVCADCKLITSDCAGVTVSKSWHKGTMVISSCSGFERETVTLSQMKGQSPNVS